MQNVARITAQKIFEAKQAGKHQLAKAIWSGIPHRIGGDVADAYADICEEEADSELYAATQAAERQYNENIGWEDALMDSYVASGLVRGY